jgi:hypothetical protein
VNTATSLTGQGSVTPILTVPGTAGGPNKIIRIIAAAGGDFLALGNAVYFIRIGGSGIKNGEQDVMIGAGGGQIVTTAQSAIIPFILGRDQNGEGNVDIEVTGGGELIIQAEMAETDIGSVGIALTLEFEHD